jgi:hypothetical protein
MLKQRDQTKQQAQQSGQQLRVSIAKLPSLEPGNKRLDLCGVSGILIWIFLHRRRRRFYAARHSEARASGHFLPFSSPGAASTRDDLSSAQSSCRTLSTPCAQKGFYRFNVDIFP